jgi:hypothetical protein
MADTRIDVLFVGDDKTCIVAGLHVLQLHYSSFAKDRLDFSTTFCLSLILINIIG